MRAGSRVLMIAAVALMCAACLLAAACEDDALISPKPMSDYVAEVSDAIGAAIGNGVENGVLGVRLEGDLNAADQSYHVDAGLSWNVDAPSGSAMSFEVTHGGESVIDIYADGSDLYADIDLDSAPWLNGKVKYVNVDIFGYFSEVLDGDDPGDILCALGNAAFDGVDVNANKTVYSFELRKDALARIVDIVGEEFAALGEAESGVVGELFGLQREAEVSGSIEIRVENGICTRISGVDLISGEDVLAFSFVFETGGDVASEVAASAPADALTYRVSKLIDAYVTDDVTLLSSAGAVAEYDYELNANLDSVVLALGGYDFAALDDDNFFHLRVEHICDATCGSYCAAKTREGSGAVFEIAFSPEAFGTHNVYVNVDVRYMIGSDFIDDNAGFIATSLSDYAMIVLTPDGFDGAARLATLTMRICSGAEAEVSVSVDDILAAFGAQGDLAKRLKEAFFTGGYSEVEEMRFGGTDGDAIQSMDYDIEKQFVWVVDDESAQLKEYEELFGMSSGSEAAMSWTFEPKAQLADKSSLSNIYNEGAYLIHGASGGEYVPMSATEAKSDELYLKMDYVDTDGDLHRDSLARIVAIEGLDASSTEIQNVVFKVQYPNMFEGSLLGSLFDGASEMFVCSVEGAVKLTPEAEDGFKLSTHTDKLYRLVTGSRTAPEFLIATATIKYQNGAVKTITVEGSSQSVLKHDSLFLPTTYSVVDWNLIAVRFSVAGRTKDLAVAIEAPTRAEFDIKEEAIPQIETGSTMYMASLTNRVRMYAYYGNEKVDVELTARDFYINNMSVAESTAEWKTEITDTDSYTAQIVFLRSNAYSVTVKKMSYVSKPFKLSVLPAQEMEVRYGLTDITGSADVNEGKSVRFSSSIVNTRHGVSDGASYALAVEVKDKSGNDVTAEVIDALTLNGVQCEGGRGETTLEEILKNPVPVSITATFDTPGTYEITLYLQKAGSVSGTSVSLHVTVKNGG